MKNTHEHYNYLPSKPILHLAHNFFTIFRPRVALINDSLAPFISTPPPTTLFLIFFHYTKHIDLILLLFQYFKSMTTIRMVELAVAFMAIVIMFMCISWLMCIRPTTSHFMCMTLSWSLMQRHSSWLDLEENWPSCKRVKFLW
jgi:hypothetical protein